MTYRVILQPQVEREIQRQARWIVEQSNSPSIALRWTRSIRSKVATLKAGPLRCPVDPDSDSHGEEVRVLLHGKRHKNFAFFSSCVATRSESSLFAMRHRAAFPTRGKANSPKRMNDFPPSRFHARVRLGLSIMDSMARLS